jgi:hypothetical protein
VLRVSELVGVAGAFVATHSGRSLLDPTKSNRRFRRFVLDEARASIAREERFRSRNGTGACAEVSRESYFVQDQPHIRSQPVDNCL